MFDLPIYELIGTDCRIIHKDIQPENIFIGPGKRSAWIGDCSVCSLLPKEVLNIRSFSSIDGNLAYISPEQTGRMNRPVDYRTDYYALGATLYEMLIGTVPFKLEDPPELVHSHLAKQPLPPPPNRQHYSQHGI